MGSSGGGSTTNNTPWENQRPFLQDIFARSQSAYNQNPTPDYFPGSTVAGQSPATQAALAQMSSGASGPVQQGFQDYLSQGFQQPQVGLGGAEQGANQYLGQIGAGQQALGESARSANYGQAAGMAGLGGGGVGQNVLGNTAAGGYLNSNPYLNAAAGQITDQFKEQIAPSIAAQFGASGRARREGADIAGGGGIQGDVLSNAAGDVAGRLASEVYMPAYESERGRQQQAAGQMENFLMNRQQLASGIYQGDRNRQLQAGMGLQQGGLGGIAGMSGMYGQQQDALSRMGSLAPSAVGLQNQTTDRMLQAGQMQDAYGQQLINADISRHDFNQQAPWMGLGQYSNMINQMPGGYGTTTTSGGQGSQMAGAAGGAMTGASLGMMTGNPYVAAAGAGAGGLYGWFA